MDKNSAPAVREGSLTANEIYLSVGLALSWWEASEDMLEMLFMHLCGMQEPIAMETFRVAPRPARSAMIRSALKHHVSRVTLEETSTVLGALKRLEKLSAMRNEIAHGHVSNVSVSADGVLTMRGNFLTSTLSPSGLLASREDNKKYAHTALEIDEWRDKVRDQRGRIMDVWEAIVMRDQDARRQLENRSS